MEEKNKLEVGWNWRRYRDLWVLGAEGWPLWAEVAEVHSLRPCSYLPSFIGLRKSFLDSQNSSLKATQKMFWGEVVEVHSLRLPTDFLQDYIPNSYNS